MHKAKSFGHRGKSAPRIGNIQVTCRIRPEVEEEINDKLCVEIIDNKSLKFSQSTDVENGASLFAFDNIFGEQSTQQQIYESTAKPIVDSVFDGYNGTILTYGAPNTGKTFTMRNSCQINSELKGIIPRTFEHISEHMKNNSDNIQYSIKLTFIEITNDKIKDLLKPEKTELRIREDKHRGLCIAGITESEVTKEEDMHNKLKIAERNRSLIMPSKSHFIAIVTVQQNKTQESVSRMAKLYLTDLAGTEKATKVSQGIIVPKMNRNINRGLAALVDVINALADEKAFHIPYRESALTRILANSFGGNSKTSLVITCSPSAMNEFDTFNTLKFGSRVKLINNIPRLNRELTLPQLKKALIKTERELNNKRKRVVALEEIIKDQGFELPPEIESFCDVSTLSDHQNRSEILRDVNDPSIMGDLESQPMSEIMDLDDQSSFFDLTNIPGGEDVDDDNECYSETADKKIKELEALMIQQKESYTKEIEALNTKLTQREKENLALLHQLELSNLKIEALRDFTEEKNERIDVLEEMKNLLLIRNQRIKQKYKPTTQKPALKENIPIKSQDLLQSIVASVSSAYGVHDQKGLTSLLETQVAALIKSLESEEKQDYKALETKYEKLKQENEHIQQKMDAGERAIKQKYYELQAKVQGLSSKTSQSAGLVPHAKSTLGEHLSNNSRTHSRHNSDLKNSAPHSHQTQMTSYSHNNSFVAESPLQAKNENLNLIQRQLATDSVTHKTKPKLTPSNSSQTSSKRSRRFTLENSNPNVDNNSTASKQNRDIPLSRKLDFNMS